MINPIVAILSKIRRDRLRRVLRGYRTLKKQGGISRIADLKNALTLHRLNLSNKNFSTLLMGEGNASGEIVIRQYLLELCGGLNLNKALLCALGKDGGKVISYLPKEWRRLLSKHGFKVATIRSGILWQIFLLAALAHGIIRMLGILSAGIISGRNLAHHQNNAIAFVGLASGNIPINSASHDVISWYLQWPGRVFDVKEIRHTAQNVYSRKVNGIDITREPCILPNLAGRHEIIRYAIWAIRASIFAVIEWIRGNWWHVLLLNQASYVAQVRILPNEALARQYLFNNSGWIYRPLWTYEVESRGSEVIFYFYSTNCESFKRSDEYPSLPYGWESMTWPRYLVWDDYQANFVRRATNNDVNVNIVGPIWFQSSDASLPQLKKPALAVFDVTPFRNSRYSILGLDYEYYLPLNSNNFLSDIADIAKHIGLIMLWKRKRNLSSLAHPQYRRFTDELLGCDEIQVVDPDISAMRVIESSYAVISMPFTSTAIIAENMGKPSVYYDPTGLLDHDDRAAHGIQIIKSKAKLLEWVEQKVLEIKFNNE